MKVLIYSGYSDANAELNALTQPVREAYATRHGYKCLTDKIDWEEWKVFGLQRIRAFLKKFDVVMSVGTDVVFTNHRKTILSVIDSPLCSPIACDENGVPSALHGLTVARENLGWWPINNDVAIWSGPLADLLIARIIDDAPIWLQYPWLWQNHLWNLMQTHEEVNAAVTVVEGRRMNSVPIPGNLSSWQLGDWICHCMDGKLPDLRRKIDLVRMMLPFVGNGTYYPADTNAKAA